MRKQIIPGAFLLFSVLMVVTTCQFQFNKLGSGTTLRVVVPQNLSGGTTSADASAAGARSLVGGASVTVTIIPVSGLPVGAAIAGTRALQAPGIQTQTLPLNGQSSLDFSFSLSSGSYNVSASMQDAGGIILATASTGLTVPAGNYPVVLTMFSSLLSDLIVADSSGTQYPLSTPFSPTTYDYPVNATYFINPIVLTAIPVDPKATITVTQNLAVVTPTGSEYTVASGLGTVTIVVTAEDGSISTYTWTPNAG